MKDNKEFYEYLDNVEVPLLKKINKLIELSKSQYKDKLVKEIKKSQFTANGFVISNEVFSSVASSMFKTVDELNIVAYKDVGEHYYNVGIEQVQELFEKESKEVVSKKYTNTVFNAIIGGFVMGNGLNFNYDQELERRMDYYNTQMANATMTAVNKKLQTVSKKALEDNYSNIVDSVSANNTDTVKTVKTQKRGIGRTIDAVGVFVAMSSVKKAYEDNGIQYVIRYAEVDGATCDYCLERNGLIMPITSTDFPPSHFGCRCWVEPTEEKPK